MRKLIVAAFIFTALSAYANPPHYEFRAVWIATVENIDWPSKRTLTSLEQQQEFTRILDMHYNNGMNAVVVQIRPVADAFYPSVWEPWSEYLTGRQGKSPSPDYDPLKFMIDECHKRGMEFHAWFNPYRAVFNVNRSSVASNHITRLRPELFVTYGQTKYFDPGLPQAREHVNRVIRDVVQRYDIDAVHMDDYFYPYKIAGKEFPDHASYQRYGNGRQRDEWRRSNVDSIILQLARTIKAVNPRVKFGISPFGVWRNSSKDPRGSASRAGVTNYDDLHADILLWLERKWIDYVAPQLYWEIGHKLVDYKMLLDWWARHHNDRHLYIGHGIYRTGEATSGAWKHRKQIPEQIKYLRNNKNVHGSIYYSSKSFKSNPNGWNDSLRMNYYRYPALPPPMHWIDSVPPLKPLVNNISKTEVRVLYRGAEPIKGFAIFSVPKGQSAGATLVKMIVSERTEDLNLALMPAPAADRLYVASVDRNNNLSDWVQVR